MLRPQTEQQQEKISWERVWPVAYDDDDMTTRRVDPHRFWRTGMIAVSFTTLPSTRGEGNLDLFQDHYHFYSLEAASYLAGMGKGHLRTGLITHL